VGKSLVEAERVQRPSVVFVSYELHALKLLLLGKFGGGQVAQGAMRPALIILDSPLFDNDPGAPAETRLRRWRWRLRSRQIMSSGRKEALNNPKLCSCWIHWQSLTSVLRPGTWRRCRALTRNTSMPAASNFW